MFISQLQLKNFKRFTAVTLDLSDAQTPPRLVLLIGANGSGKSSVFDAFEWLTKPSKDGSLSGEIAYYSKTSQSVDSNEDWCDGIPIGVDQIRLHA